MEEIRRRFENEIAARLAGAAESDAKTEMIEELAENLTRRYEDMTGAGVGTEDAFAQAMDELGDPAELAAYLNSLEPDEEPPTGEDGADELWQSVYAAGKLAMEEAQKAVRLAQEQMRRIKKQGGVKRRGRVVTNVSFDENGGSAAVDHDGWMDRSISSAGIRALDIETVNGDVDIYLTGGEDDPIRIEGHVDKLEIYATEEGVLTVRERPTAIGQLFTLRGLTSADVSLTIPARRWERVRVTTANGDMDMGDDLEVGELDVRTACGDLDCRVRSCGTLRVKSASGDIDLSGNVETLRAETASGDVELRGPVGEAAVTTASGDVELAGSVVRARVKSMSGDITVASMTLPMGLELSSKSGDVEARIPDTGPFAVRLNTFSGEARYDFPRRWAEAAGPDDPRPQYTLSSVSGDVMIRKY